MSPGNRIQSGPYVRHALNPPGSESFARTVSRGEDEIEADGQLGNTHFRAGLNVDSSALHCGSVCADAIGLLVDRIREIGE